MPVAENAIFKLVSLRRPIDGLTIDPVDDVSGSQIEKLINGLKVNPSKPDREVIRRIQSQIQIQPILTEDILQRFPLHQIHEQLYTRTTLPFQSLTSIRVGEGESSLSLVEYSTTDEFADAYRQITDSWLALRLLNSQELIVELHEKLIRAAHLCVRLRKAPDTLREPRVIDYILQARIVFPRNWRSAIYEQQELNAKYSAKLATMQPPTPSVRASKIAKAKLEHAELVERIALRESLQSKVHAVHTQWKKQIIAATSASPQVANRSPRRGGFLQRTSDFLLGTPAPIVRLSIAPISPLDQNFYSQLANSLTNDERQEFRTTVGSLLPSFNDLTHSLDIGDLVLSANDACASIQVWEDEETQQLPESDPAKPTSDRPSVRAIGFGQLVVARERLVGYEAHEIAHIENVLSGEERYREHERTNTTEQVIETENTTNTESERDLQTTDRYEIQTESQKTIEQEFSIQAGVNTSGRYGLTEVNTSLDAGFQQSQSESRSSSTQLAKDVVSRAVERTSETVRELRRLTITEQIRELNTHKISSLPAGTSPSISGVYLWVEKIHEVELRQYGQRTMVEFHIPEPAISLLQQNNPNMKDIRKPAPLKIGPKDVNQGNYLCLTKLYGADDVEPPPSLHIQVGYTWASTPDEGVDEDTAEEAVSDTINIPDGYLPVSGHVIVSTITAKSEFLDAVVAIGGRVVITVDGTDTLEQDFDFDPIVRWPQGVPMSLRSHGAFDKTLVAHVTLLCKRTVEAYTAWQLRTWEKIRDAHRVLVREYERAVDEVNLSSPALFQIQGRPEAQNRQIEMEELRKWAIKIMRWAPPNVESFQFDAVKTAGDYPEIFPPEADFQAPIVRFFEEAFEWRQMTYFLYPYFWGRRDSWRFRQQITDADPRHEAFLRAGAARVIVPITPGYEERVLHYLEADPAEDEFKKIAPPPPPSADSPYEDLWLELLINKNEELALGSGTLSVTKGQTSVTINEDSTWFTSDRDLGRELYIDGERYTIASISSTNRRQFDLDEAYKSETKLSVRYATGSVPFGPPWLVRIPTSLVILSEETSKLAGLFT